MIDLVKTLDEQPPEWTIESLPLRHDRGEVSGVSALVRSDNGATVALVHRGFSPIQNREGIKLAESLGYKFQGARITHEGRRVFLLFDLQTLEMAGEEVSIFLCLTNAYGSAVSTVSLEAPDREAFLAPHLVFRRQACLNVFDSLWFGRWDSPRIIPSTDDSSSVLKNWIRDSIDGSLKAAQRLLASRIQPADVERFAFSFLPSAQQTTLRDLWRNTPDLESVRETGWGAYQAVAAYLTHHHPHNDVDWWLNQEETAFEVLSTASLEFQRQANDIPFMAWNSKTGSYERRR